MKHETTRAASSGSFLGLLTAALLCGCATAPRPAQPRTRQFDFQRDTFAFANELVWDYKYDTNGNWTSMRHEPRPEYSLRCFVVARSAWQFFENARFAPQQPTADENGYRRLIRRVVSTNPRRVFPNDKKIEIPGYEDLRAFSLAQGPLLKAECGGAWQSYFQWSHWRMIFPFSRREQQRMAKRLAGRVKRDGAVVIHLVRFPQLTINHGMLIFACHETDKEIDFTAYDPNQPAEPRTLAFDRATRTFLLQANDYFPGGRVDVYEVYGGCQSD